MKYIIFSVGIPGVVLLGPLCALQYFPGRNILRGNKTANMSPSFYRLANLDGSGMASGDGELSFQTQDVSFSHLKVKEAERQSKGAVKEEDAIQSQERVFTDSETWRAFWSSYQESEVPNVDFRKYQVAAVFLGAKPNPGYGVEIKKIIYNPRKKLTVIHVVESLPAPEMSYLALLVYPSDIVVFPPQPGKVQFVRTKRVRPTAQP
jgi:hypothetical protein